MYFVRKLNIAIFLFAFLILLSGRAEAKVITVQAGDTLYSLSKITGVPIDKIKQCNNLYSDSVTAGQALLIPERYTVKSGDTLYLISQSFGIDVSELKALNNLNSEVIWPGQALYIPQRSLYQQITVKKGDTLYLISKNYGVSIDDLKVINGLWGNEIYVGMKLLIPSKASSSTQKTSDLPSRGGISRGQYIKYGTGVYHTLEERALLARLIEAEAEGEPYIGKVAVGAVVVNRVLSDKFPNTIKDVIYHVDETGAYQFEPVLDGRLFTVVVSSDSYKAADEALGGLDPTGGALFFFNPYKISNKWLLSKPIIYRIGNHVFAE
ncbi:LysM peptidoglycan-binding domain-containing protein [Tepidanaerobacter acetatoxydans]|uniref:LysM peptidoglycan-binding domain-containing protein n=1 Tax=Tepidanaerobacter acetatoxydans TaxID=499229 RepID=UPI0002DB67D0|nr:LysM peptidoglycan-binding domain-containing protein [Tepidanaerobacter acetatoxydans]